MKVRRVCSITLSLLLGLFSFQTQASVRDLLRSAFSDGSVIDKVAVSPNGKRLAYAVFRPNDHTSGSADAYYRGARLAIVDLTTGNTVDPLPTAETTWLPSWDPSGSQLAFLALDSESYGNQFHLWVYDVESGASRRLSMEPIALGLGGRPLVPYWSASGKKIVASVATHTVEQENEASALNTPDRSATVYRSGKERLDEPTPRSVEQNYIALHPARIIEVDAVMGSATDLRLAGPAIVAASSPSGQWIASYSTVTNLYLKTNGHYDHNRYHYFTTNLSIIGSEDNGAGEFSVHDVDYTDQKQSLSWLPGDRLIYQTAGLLNIAEMHDGKFRSRPLAHEVVRARSFEASRDARWLAVVGGLDYTRGGLPGVTKPTDELLLIDLSDGSVRRQQLPAGVTLNSNSLLTTQGRLWQPSEHEVMLLGYHENTAQQVLLRHNIGTGKSRVVWRHAGLLTPLDGPEDQSFIVASYEDTSTPLNLVRIRPEGSFDKISGINPPIDGFPEVEVREQVVEVPGWDGSRLSARSALIVPKGSTADDRLPTLVVNYPGLRMSRYAYAYGGGREAGIPAAALLSRGYAVLYIELPVRPRTTIGNRAHEPPRLSRRLFPLRG